MPFITEEIWQHLPERKEALIISTWPVYKEENNYPEAEKKNELYNECYKRDKKC